MTLVSALEREGLSWEAIDPPSSPISYWRKQLESLVARRPRVLGISSTFTMDGRWLAAICRLAKQILPQSTLVVGGYLYTTDTKAFLSLPADVLCVGEGEVRLPQIARAVQGEGRLDQIPGLFLRRADGELVYTGKISSLDLNEVPAVDFRLAERCTPPIDLQASPMQVGLETVRGCLFMCEFCTFRNLARYGEMTASLAAERIVRAGRSVPHGSIALIDSTATFPRDRWATMMRELIARGGSPHPIWCHARVSDLLDDETVALMSGAGLRLVTVGMESGSQTILNLMHKGTRADHVPTALAGLARHGVKAWMNFIYGFPGETDETVAETHAMIVKGNDGFEEQLPWLWYNIDPFLYMDFSSIARKKNATFATTFEQNASGTARASVAVLNTALATSKKPTAPVFAILFDLVDWPHAQPQNVALGLMRHPRQLDIFRWLKKIEQGIAVFLEHEVHGVPVDRARLRELKGEILRPYRRLSAPKALAYRAATQLGKLAIGRVQREWEVEGETGKVGPITRALLAVQTVADGRDLPELVVSIKTGAYVPPGGKPYTAMSHVPQTEAEVRSAAAMQTMVDDLFKESEAAVSDGKVELQARRKAAREATAEAERG
ncbi:MAG: B12-binding domain-containing radical SAM protein [Deltaproteobacteria bacterium]|nr:B12-binding domain-containing radical SAM protein [Deltaproteobacteria bacterium]